MLHCFTMNKLITIALLFCCLQVINAAVTKNTLYDARNKFERQFNNKCRAPGLTCKNCETLMFCIETESGVFEENIVQTCKTPEESCLLNRCAKEPNPKCPIKDGNTFICTGTGIFPDPYDCSSYHVCIEKDNIIADDGIPVNDLYAAVKCPENWGYNPISTYCDKPLSDGFCPNEAPIPTCTRIGDIGAIDGTSIYYLCTTDGNGELRPILHMCPHGNVIDDDGKCKIKSPPTTPAPATTEATTVPPATTAATTEATTVPPATTAATTTV